MMKGAEDSDPDYLKLDPDCVFMDPDLVSAGLAGHGAPGGGGGSGIPWEMSGVPGGGCDGGWEAVEAGPKEVWRLQGVSRKLGWQVGK
jgi:hypothetical protein